MGCLEKEAYVKVSLATTARDWTAPNAPDAETRALGNTKYQTLNPELKSLKPAGSWIRGTRALP
eukprot:968908-Pyramimonas_sp.AAC.1